jgi:hypothetical protein
MLAPASCKALERTVEAISNSTNVFVLIARAEDGEPVQGRRPAPAGSPGPLYDVPVGLDRPPKEFDKGRPPSAEQMAAQRRLSHGDVQTLERCIAEHHEVDVDYTDAKGTRSTIRMRPAFIRYSAAEHLVLWGIPDEGNWEELRLDRIHSVRDTGLEFSPSW